MALVDLCEYREMRKPLKVMDSLDEGRERFSQFKPLSERLSREVRMLSAGELFGGTSAFNRRAFLGVCSMLKQERYDLLVINGGALPEVPSRGSRGNRQKMEFLMEGIEDIEDSCHVMRRAMKLLVESAGKTPILYVMGEEDHANIEAITDRLIAESRKAEHLGSRIESLKGEAAALDSRVAGMEEESESLLRQMRQLRRRDSRASKSGGGREGVEERIRKLSREMREVSRKREELIGRRKKLGERIALLEDDLKNLGAVRRTNIEYLTPAETRELKASATAEYTALLLRLFEGADVHIASQNVSLVEVGGLRMAVGHSLENTSRTAKRTALAAREEIQSKFQIYGLIPRVDLFLFSHHPGTKGWALPQAYADRHPLYLFQQGGLADPPALFDAYNRKIKTPQTEALDKHQLDSGVSVITASRDGSLSFEMIGLAQLEQSARALLSREWEALRKRLEKLDTAGKPGPGPQGEEDAAQTRKLRAQLSLELPSRLSDSQLSALVDSKVPLERMLEPPAIRKVRQMIAEVHSDYHIGIGNPWDSYSNQEIMRAAIADSRDLGRPDLLIFGGDMVEGTLGSKANEVVARNFLDEREFRRLLEKRVEGDRSLGRLDFERAMAEYYRRASYAYTVPNLDQQIHLLIPLLEHAADVVSKGGQAIFISGNHYNQSHRDERLDEAIRLSSAVRMIGGFRDNDPRIHVFYGGWIGSGQVTVDGIPIFGIHKARSSRDHVTGLMEHKTLQRREGVFLFIQGHHHDMAFGKTVADAHVSAPSIAPIIPYVDQASLHGGLQGYTRLTMWADQFGRHFESLGVQNRFVPQLEKRMEKIDPLFLEIFGMMVKKAAGS